MSHGTKNPAILLDHHLLVVGIYGSDRYCVSELVRLIGTVGCICVGHVAGCPSVFAAAKVLDLGLLAGELAFLHVQLPFPDKRIVCGSECAREQARKH